MENKKDHAGNMIHKGWKMKLCCRFGFSDLYYSKFKEDKQMYTTEEKKSIRTEAALELARHKMLMKMAKGYSFGLNEEDINEVMIVAGLPLLTPDELNAPELDVIKVNKED